MSELKTSINSAMKAAMRAKEKPRLSAIRLIQAEIKRIEVDERIEIDDVRLLSILDKMQKQRRDSLQQYEDAGREDLAEIERFELAVIQEFLPAQMDDKAIDAALTEAISASGASSMADMGKVMALLKPKLQGRADMGAVSTKLKAKLSA